MISQTLADPARGSVHDAPKALDPARGSVHDASKSLVVIPLGFQRDKNVETKRQGLHITASATRSSMREEGTRMHAAGVGDVFARSPTQGATAAARPARGMAVQCSCC